MVRPLLAAVLLTAALIGGLALGVLRAVTDTGEDW